MTNILLKVNGSSAVASADGKITSGMVGLPVVVEYDESWYGLTKTAFFRVGNQVRKRNDIGTATTIPWEILRTHGKTLEIGIEGRDADGNIVLPTTWCVVDHVYEGASGEIQAAPNPVNGNYPNGNGVAIDDGQISTETTWSSKKIFEEINFGNNHSTIVCEANGETILLTDSAKATLQGFKMCGKSTQDGTPTPENPVEIVSAGADGEIGVKLGGKNLFAVNADKTASYGGLSRKYMDDGGYEFTGTATAHHWATHIQLTATVPDDGIYTLSVDANVFPGQGVMYQHHRGDTQLKVVTGRKKLSYTATMQKGDTLLVLVGVTNGEVVNSTVYVQLELGSTATDFEKPKDAQTLTALTPGGLHKGDYIDWEKGVRVQKRFLYVVTGNENVAYYGEEGPDRLPFIYVENAAGDFSECDSNMLTCATNYNGLVGTDNTVAISNGRIVFHFEGIQGVGTEKYPTNADLGSAFKAKIAEINASGTPLEVLYEMDTPIETPLTEEELAQFAALQTNYPTTTIFNDEGVGMEVSYVADTKNYIDKKFTELAAAIVANA